MSDTHDAAPNEAVAALSQLPLDRELVSALQNPGHPGHKAATAHRRSLYAAAYARDDDGGPAVPERDAPANALYTAPEDSKEYCFDAAPHGVPYDTELEQKARGWFHQAGLPQWLARNIVLEWNRAIERAPNSERVAGDAATTERALRQCWGDAYEERIVAARSLVRSLNSEEAIALLDRSGLANNEYIIRQLAALAESRTAGADRRAASSH
jgi:hypothetical protein